MYNKITKHGLSIMICVLIAAGLPPGTALGKWQLVPLFVAWIIFDIGHEIRITEQNPTCGYITQTLATSLALFAIYVGLFLPPVV